MSSHDHPRVPYVVPATGIRTAPANQLGELTPDQQRALARTLSGSFEQWVEMMADQKGLTPAEIRAGVAGIVCRGSGMTAA